MDDALLHHVIIRCPEKAGMLVHELRARAGRHIHGNVRLTTVGADRVIELTVDDVDLVRRAVDDAAPEGTRVQVDIPTQRAAAAHQDSEPDPQPPAPVAPDEP